MKVSYFLIALCTLCQTYFSAAEQSYSSCNGANQGISGVQTIKLGNDTLEVYCETPRMGKSGWVVIQRRVSAEENFYRNWTTYENGFGDINKNFFIGLKTLNQMTKLKPHELYVYVENFNGKSAFAYYDSFSVGDASSKYKLQVGTYYGTAGNNLKGHNNMMFSTYDRDNDRSTENCAAKFTGAWWYNQCYDSNLNGAYLGNGQFGNKWGDFLYGSGIVWKGFQDFTFSLKTVYMMVRPTS
ncbi:uncharacterized protein Dana_GF19798 [Drosophila ananassae]|uniref:Fibrinogen C-terminal domain-containing protein n=1 Tax=Drosophila ananassae TaxID=7217 RepID=B3MEN7_DROAN|nr:angiopoietin-related protein 6 [Drosophila ananassae]EDV35501.1 uncharacterized protein Dana_GF19798 [Drosophila ananassae]